MFGYPCVRASKLMKLLHDITHQIHTVVSPRPVVTDGACHPLVNGLINHRNRKPSVFPVVNILIFKHNTVTVEAVHNNIDIILPAVIAHDRHCVPVRLDAFIQKPHLRRRHGVRVIGIWLYLVNRNGNHIVNRAFICHSPSPPHSCTCAGSHQCVFAAPCSFRSP